jgi:hypothetical protein
MNTGSSAGVVWEQNPLTEIAHVYIIRYDTTPGTDMNAWLINPRIMHTQRIPVTISRAGTLRDSGEEHEAIHELHS